MMADEDEQNTDNPEAVDGADTDAAPNDDGEDGEESEEESGGGKKKLIILLAIPLLLIAGGAGAYFSGMLDSLLGKEECVEEVDDHGEVINECPEEEEHAEASDHGGGGDHGDGHGGAGGNFLEIPTMIVNLNTENGTPRYLRLTVQLEMQNAADVAAVEAVIPRVVDQFQTYLRELRVKDLRGSAGIYRLQMELLWRVNQAAAPVEVKDVLFQEILIQ